MPDLGIRFSLAVLRTAGLLGLSAVCAVQGRGMPEQDGIHNFGKVNAYVYRGAQIDAVAVTNLHVLGVKAIINLRMTNDVWNQEAAQAQANGMVYTNVPMRGTGRPTDAQVGKVLALIETLPGPVFVHCEHGCDRTGTIIACYRIKHDGWPADRALEEAKRYGLSPFEPEMKGYILDFARRKE